LGQAMDGSESTDVSMLRPDFESLSGLQSVQSDYKPVGSFKMGWV